MYLPVIRKLISHSIQVSSLPSDFIEIITSLCHPQQVTEVVLLLFDRTFMCLSNRMFISESQFPFRLTFAAVLLR